MAKKRTEQEEEHHLEGSGGMRWLLTYADMITLLLGLFIILASISSADQAKFNNIAGQAADVFNVPNVLPITGSDKVLPGGTGVMPYKTPEKDEEPSAGGNTGIEGVSITETKAGTLITMSSGILFDPGSAELMPKAKKAIDEVYTKYLEQTKNAIVIKGHTDWNPISNLVFPSNWELSTARAGTVARYLIHRWGVADYRITTAGYAHTQPIASNMNEDGRAMNRRVELWIMKSEPEVNVVPSPKESAINSEKTDKSKTENLSAKDS